MLLKGTVTYKEEDLISTKEGVIEEITLGVYAQSMGVDSLKYYLYTPLEAKNTMLLQDVCDTMSTKALREDKEKVYTKYRTAYSKLLYTYLTSVLHSKKKVVVEDGIIKQGGVFKAEEQQKLMEELQGKIIDSEEVYNIIQKNNTLVLTDLNKKRKETLKELYTEMKAMQIQIEDISSVREICQYFDAPRVEDTWRRVDVKSTGCTTNVFNKRFASILTAVTIYTLNNGVVETQLGVTHNAGDALTYYITDKNDNIMGRYVLQGGEIKQLSIDTPYIKLCLKEIEDEQLPGHLGVIFQKLQEKDKYKRYCSITPVKSYKVNVTKALVGFELKEYNREVNTENTTDLFKTFEEVERAYPDKNFKWVHERKYKIVSPEEVDIVMEDFIKFSKKINPITGKKYLIAVDTETTGTHINVLSRVGKADQIVGICLSKEIGTGYYIPLQMRSIENVYGGNAQAFMDRYKSFFEGADFVVHNASFDWKVFYIYHINLHYVMDTMLVFGCTYRYMYGKNYKYSLKALTKKHFGIDQLGLHHFKVGGKWTSKEEEEDASTFADLPYEFVEPYACADADFTLALSKYCIEERIIENFEVEKVYNIELEFARAVAYSEFHGMHIDLAHLPELVKEFEEGKAKCEAELIAMAKEMGAENFNKPTSTPQLQYVIYDVMGLPEIEGRKSTDKKDMKPLAKQKNADGTLKYPFIAKLLEFRNYNTIYTNFIKRRNEVITEQGLIFASVFALGTETGRCCVKEPNYQSYNDIIKKYVCPRQGYKEWDSDFSQIEYRVLCSMAQQKNLMEAFKDPDMDYHTLQASNMFQVPYAMVTKEMRSNSKTFNFGLPYGMGIKSLAKGLGVSEAEATILYDKYFDGQENILKFFEDVRAEGVRTGKTRTKYGRLRYYNKGVFSTSAIRRQAGNHVIQGTAADIWKMAVNQLMQSIIDNGWLDKVLLDGFIHDEVLGEVSEEINFFEFVKVWRESFQIQIDGFCQLYAGLGIGNSWYEAKKQDLTPQFVEEIINSKHKDNWDGDGDRFCRWLNKAFKQHKIRRVKQYIQAEANQGQVIKPAINALLEESVKEYLETTEKDYTEKGVIYKDKVPSISGLQTYLQVYCDWQGVDFTKIDIKAAQDIEMGDNASQVPDTEPVKVQDDYTILESNTDALYVIQAIKLGYAIKGFDIYISYDKLQKATEVMLNVIFSQSMVKGRNRGYNVHIIHNTTTENEAIIIDGKIITDYYKEVTTLKDEGVEYLIVDMDISLTYDSINNIMLVLNALCFENVMLK